MKKCKCKPGEIAAGINSVQFITANEPIDLKNFDSEKHGEKWYPMPILSGEIKPNGIVTTIQVKRK